MGRQPAAAPWWRGALRSTCPPARAEQARAKRPAPTRQAAQPAQQQGWQPRWRRREGRPVPQRCSQGAARPAGH
eukprot:9526566-Alexandrium_andersonii.AAC.1